MWTAADVYGGAPAPQPTGAPGPGNAHASMAKTTATSAKNPIENPTLLLVVIMGIALALITFSLTVSGSIGVK